MWFNYLIQVIISTVSVGLTYFFGRLDASRIYKTNVQERRYEDFYKEFLKNILKLSPTGKDFSSLSLDVRSILLDLLFDNLHLLDEQTVSLVPQFYRAFIAMLEYNEGTPGFEHAPEEYNKIFMEIVRSVLQESRVLAKSLGLPDISRSVGKSLGVD